MGSFALGITKAALPDILDQHGNLAKMTMNRIPIDITDLKVLSNLKKLSNYPPYATMEALDEISKAFRMYIEENEETSNGEPLEILHRLQAAHIQVQNKLFANKSRIRVSLQDSISKMVHNHAEAVLMKDSAKLNLAMHERAECILSGSKDKELASTLIDNMWSLINKSKTSTDASAGNDKDHYESKKTRR
jgi:hypothetical protein